MEAAPPVLVKDAASIGALVRARRLASGLTQAQAAGLAGVGTRFLSELERGKQTVELHRVLQVLERFGFELAIAPRGARAFEPRASAVPPAAEPVQKPGRPRSTPRRGRRG